MDREALALSWGMTHFRVYLLGRQFTAFTDHRPLLGLQKPDQVTDRQFRMFDLKYLHGTENVFAATLSRDVVQITTVAYHSDPCLEDEVRRFQRQPFMTIMAISTREEL